MHFFDTLSPCHLVCFIETVEYRADGQEFESQQDKVYLDILKNEFTSVIFVGIAKKCLEGLRYLARNSCHPGISIFCIIVNSSDSRNKTRMWQSVQKRIYSDLDRYFLPYKFTNILYFLCNYVFFIKHLKFHIWSIYTLYFSFTILYIQFFK